MKSIFFGLCFLQLTNAFTQTKNMLFSFKENTKEIVRTNKILKEEVYIYTFNKKGIKDSALAVSYKYDTLGDLLEQKAASLMAPIRMSKKFSYSYYPSGQLRRIVEDNGNKITIHEYEYDSVGNEIFKYEYDKDTTTLTTELKVFNEKKQVVQLLTRFNNGPYKLSRRYFYNGDGDLWRIEAVDHEEKLQYVDSYDYDKSLNKKISYLENTQGKNKVKEYIYNKDQLCLREIGTHKSVSGFSGGSMQYDMSEEVIENIYAANKVVLESNVYLDGKKVQMVRHFYFYE
jgi:hypothetical protein